LFRRHQRNYPGLKRNKESWIHQENKLRMKIQTSLKRSDCCRSTRLSRQRLTAINLKSQRFVQQATSWSNRVMRLEQRLIVILTVLLKPGRHYRVGAMLFPKVG
jgi:hypothetical protein